MKVAFWYDLTPGGAFRAMCGQVRELQRLGHETAIWTPGSMDFATAPAWIPEGVNVRVIPYSAVGKRSFLERRFGGGIDHVRSRIGALNTHMQSACDEMRDWGADVVFAHNNWWFQTSPVGKYWRGPCVLYLQEPNRSIHEASPINPWLLAEPTNKSLKTFLGHNIRDARYNHALRLQLSAEIEWSATFDRVLVNSLYSRESVLRAYGQESFFCPLGVDHVAFSALPAVPKQRVVVSLGELAPHKGTLLAVQAIGSIPESERPMFRWFGNRVDEPYAKKVVKEAESLKVDFEFERMVPDEALAVHLGSAACMMYCPRLEPLGFAPLEANLCGTAVVAVAEGGVRETIVPGVNGTLVNGRDAEALGVAVLHYVNDLSLASIEGQRARRHVKEHHSWETAGKELERHLSAVIAHHRTNTHQQSA